MERDDDREVGIYDWYEIYKASRKDPRVDIGDYLGSVEIAQDAEEVFVEESAAEEKTRGERADKTAKKRGRGRYLRANRSVRQGELLMVVKPYACVYASDLEKDNSIFAVNLHDLAVESATQTATAQTVISRALDQPYTYDLLNHLYAGPDYPQPEVLPAADLISSPAIDLPTLMTMQQPIIDPSKVDKWISYNSFVAERLGPALKPSPDAGPEHSSRIDPSYPKSKPSALYLLPSLANHACVPSARWVCYGVSPFQLLLLFHLPFLPPSVRPLTLFPFLLYLPSSPSSVGRLCPPSRPRPRQRRRDLNLLHWRPLPLRPHLPPRQTYLPLHLPPL
jgi:hypothetical protein